MDIEKKAKSIIDDAYSDVIQELLIIDESGVPHLVLIHSLEYDDTRGIKIEFSTPDGDKEALFPLVSDAIKAQLGAKEDKTLKVNSVRRKFRKKSLWKRFLDFIGSIHF